MRDMRSESKRQRAAKMLRRKTLELSLRQTAPTAKRFNPSGLSDRGPAVFRGSEPEWMPFFLGGSAARVVLRLRVLEPLDVADVHGTIADGARHTNQRKPEEPGRISAGRVESAVVRYQVSIAAALAGVVVLID